MLQCSRVAKTKLYEVLCSMLLYVAVCLSMLQYAYLCCSMLLYVAVSLSMLQYAPLCCSMLLYVAVCFSMLQYAPLCCSMLPYVAVCFPLQYASLRSALVCFSMFAHGCRPASKLLKRY